MKKITSLLLCLMLVLSVAVVPAAAEQGSFGANVTMENGIVTVTVSAAAVANARLHVDFDPATHFGPGLNMNRASFVTLLGRLEGVAEAQVQTLFADVPADSFYSGYVAWAVEKGITNGISANLFGPAEPINRAQMVTFLYRYVQSEGMDVTVENADAVLAQYPDADTLPEWAKAPFAWAIDRGIVNGMGGRLNPDGTANRAQVAVMLYRFFYEG